MARTEQMARIVPPQPIRAGVEWPARRRSAEPFTIWEHSLRCAALLERILRREEMAAREERAAMVIQPAMAAAAVMAAQDKAAGFTTHPSPQFWTAPSKEISLEAEARVRVAPVERV